LLYDQTARTEPRIKGLAKAKKISYFLHKLYRGADKSLARLGRKQATETEFGFHISYL